MTDKQREWARRWREKKREERTKSYSRCKQYCTVVDANGNEHVTVHEG